MTRFIAPALIGLVGIAILVALGTWQLQRLTWKQGILAEIEAQIAAPPAPLPRMFEPAMQRFKPVELEGEVAPGELHVLVSRKTFGAGYRIIAPFQTWDGRRVLVDRGFVPDEAKTAARGIGPARIVGNLHWPDDRNSATPQNDVAGNIWFARDIAAMADKLRTEPVLVVVRSAAPADPTVTPLPVNTSGIPNDHLQYAITWFSLAAVWAAMSLYWIARLARKTGP